MRAIYSTKRELNGQGMLIIWWSRGGLVEEGTFTEGGVREWT